jgi:small subunit ribosomal protein S9
MEQIIAVGRRKASIARIFLAKGSGKITINGKDYKQFMPVVHLQDRIVLPLKTIDAEKDFDIQVNVTGGGVKGQTEAVMLGIARALVKVNEEEFKPLLKVKGLLTRDPRSVERKKPGLRKARKREQYSKR